MKITPIVIAVTLLCGSCCRSEPDQASSGSATVSLIANTNEIPQLNSSPAINNTNGTELQPIAATILPDLVTKVLTYNSTRQDPFKFHICEVCACQEANPFSVNCSSRELKDAFLISDWPSDDLLGSTIDANFDNNEFTEITQFPSLSLLKLSYRGNNIQFIQKAAFKYLTSLNYLDLSQNSLTHESVGATVFEGQFTEEDYEPIPLKTLKLGYNRIHSIDKDAFHHLAGHLEILELNNNPLTVIDHQTAIAITSLRKLKVLNLAETQLKNVPDGFLHALPALIELILSGNHFPVVPEDIQRAINLEFLNLNNNPIKHLDAKSFQGLTLLRRLNISNMPLMESIAANTFTPLSSMSHLWCSFNPVLRRVHRGAFNNMAITDNTLELREFHFRGNRVNNLPPKLLPWSELDFVDIGENPFICDCRIGWIITEILPIVAEKTPDLIAGYSCSGPEGFKGQILEDLKLDANIVNCTISNDNENPTEDNENWYLTDDDEIITSSSPKPPTPHNGLILLSIFGMFSVIGGLACFILLAVKKSHLRQLYDTGSGQIVHYVRTSSGSEKMEDEQAIVEREFTQYHQEP